MADGSEADIDCMTTITILSDGREFKVYVKKILALFDNTPFGCAIKHKIKEGLNTIEFPDISADYIAKIVGVIRNEKSIFSISLPIDHYIFFGVREVLRSILSSLLKQIIEQIDDDSKISGLFSLAELFNMEFVVDVFYIYHSGYSNESPVLHVSYDLELNKETKVIEVDNQLTLKKTDDSDDSDDSDDNEHINWADYNSDNNDDSDDGSESDYGYDSDCSSYSESKNENLEMIDKYEICEEKYITHFLFDKNSMITQLILLLELLSNLIDNNYSNILKYQNGFIHYSQKQNGFIQKVKVKVDKSIKYCLLNKKLKKLKRSRVVDKEFCNIDIRTLQIIGHLLNIEALKNLCEYSKSDEYDWICVKIYNDDVNKLYSLSRLKREVFKEKTGIDMSDVYQQIYDLYLKYRNMYNEFIEINRVLKLSTKKYIRESRHV